MKPTTAGGSCNSDITPGRIFTYDGVDILNGQIFEMFVIANPSDSDKSNCLVYVYKKWGPF